MYLFKFFIYFGVLFIPVPSFRYTHEFKYIFLWHDEYYDPLWAFMYGQKAFLRFNCTYKNCFVFTNTMYFGVDYQQFDAIVFAGVAIQNQPIQPAKRYQHQKYVYLNMEPASLNNICPGGKDNAMIFNWTATYRLDSDIPFKYFVVLDKNSGAVVGPKINMNWIENMNDVDERFAESLTTKTKAAAWFVSSCHAEDRNKFVEDLKRALKKYRLYIDIYGKCGPLKCPRTSSRRCEVMLKRDYYFYLALENSFDEDYVSEKVLHGYLNNVVPIVFGGANYSRFLPPSSYLDGRAQSVDKLASFMYAIIKTPLLYQQFFRWQNHYRFVSTMPEEDSGPIRLFEETNYEGVGVCSFCEALHNENKFRKVSSYKNIRLWWNPKAKSC